MLRRIVRAFEDGNIHGVIPVVPVTDSLRALDGKGGSQSVDRSRFVAVQTPQAFHKGLLAEAYGKATSAEGFTDDASVMEAAGFTSLALTAGDPDNMKITNPTDLSIAEAILSSKTL